MNLEHCTARELFELRGDIDVAINERTECVIGKAYKDDDQYFFITERVEEFSDSIRAVRFRAEGVIDIGITEIADIEILERMQEVPPREFRDEFRKAVKRATEAVEMVLGAME